MVGIYHTKHAQCCHAAAEQCVTMQCVTLCYMCVNIVVCHCYDVFETQLDAVTLQQNIKMFQAVTMSHMSRCCRRSPLTATATCRCSQFPACSALLSTGHTAPARSRSSELMLTHHRTQSLIQRPVTAAHSEMPRTTQSRHRRHCPGHHKGYIQERKGQNNPIVQ